MDKTPQTIKNILHDWKEKGLTHGQIKSYYGISNAVEYAITEIPLPWLSYEEIAERVNEVQENWTRKQIQKWMEFKEKQ